MDRNEAEREIAKHLLKVRDLYHEYNPDGGYLNITFWYNATNANDKGAWDMWTISGNNSYAKEDNTHPINFHAMKDIKDEKYWACITPEEDAEEDEAWSKEHGDDLLDDGTYVSHFPVDPITMCKNCAYFQRLTPKICRCELQDAARSEYDRACGKYEVTA